MYVAATGHQYRPDGHGRKATKSEMQRANKHYNAVQARNHKKKAKPHTKPALKAKGLGKSHPKPKARQPARKQYTNPVIQSITHQVKKVVNTSKSVYQYLSRLSDAISFDDINSIGLDLVMIGEGTGGVVKGVGLILGGGEITVSGGGLTLPIGISISVEGLASATAGLILAGAGYSKLKNDIDSVMQKFSGKGKGRGGSKQKNGTPKNNQAQNKQARDAANQFNLSEVGKRFLHDEITHQNYSYQEILEIAKSIAEMGGKYIK